MIKLKERTIQLLQIGSAYTQRIKNDDPSIIDDFKKVIDYMGIRPSENQPFKRSHGLYHYELFDMRKGGLKAPTVIEFQTSSLNAKSVRVDAKNVLFDWLKGYEANLRHRGII